MEFCWERFDTSVTESWSTWVKETQQRLPSRVGTWPNLGFRMVSLTAAEAEESSCESNAG